MKSTQNALTSLLKVAACAILALGSVAQAQDKKADPTGTWTWSQPGRNGGPERKSTLKLKLEGDKVTGTLTAPGSGGQMSDLAISEGRLKDGEISFAVSREFLGNKITANYNGNPSSQKARSSSQFGIAIANCGPD